jgi:dTDP-4-amino-4,6-dideoxygalactose transaminase
MKQIRLVDLAAQNREISDDVEVAFSEIHRNTAYVGGPQIAAFESQFGDYLGVRHVVGVGSGTDALRLSLLAIGVGRGDEVITSPMTSAATVEAIIQAGGRPTFIDIDPVTCNIDVDAVHRYLSAARYRTLNGPRAILPVHLYGLPAAMEPLLDVANRFGLKVVEDACQAHGSRARVRGHQLQAGAIGDVGCFSFSPGKNLGAWGDGGAIATNDPEIAARIAMLRDHGRISHYAHQECGFNSRLDTLQAAVLSAKLTRLDNWNASRRVIAHTYDELLKDTGVTLPPASASDGSNHHRYVIRHERRDAIRNALLVRGIECGIHYPVPLHLQPALRSYGYRSGDFPSSESAADTVLSLPMHPHLITSDLELIVDTVRQALVKKPILFAGGHHLAAAAWPPPHAVNRDYVRRRASRP